MMRAIFALLLIWVSVSAFGQERAKVSGYVRDADGNPLDLVNIRVQNTLIGTMSNEKGYYSLSVSKGDSVTIVFSCLGYNKAERIIPQLNGDMRQTEGRWRNAISNGLQALPQAPTCR